MASTHQQPDRFATETIDGTKAKLRLYLNPVDYDYKALLVIEHDETWKWGIDSEEVATLLSHADAPDWMREVVRDVAGVEVSVDDD